MVPNQCRYKAELISKKGKNRDTEKSETQGEKKPGTEAGQGEVTILLPHDLFATKLQVANIMS